MSRAVGPLFALGVLSTLTGCYFAKQAEGQLHVLFGSRSIESMLQDSDLSPEARQKLRLVLEVKEFGERHIGLSPSTNYTRFYDTEGRPVSWIVSACRKDRFEPYTWWFPIVGRLPYKGFFRKSDAMTEARSIAGPEYDVLLSPVSAYSTLGWFSDPVFSPMLQLPEEDLAALILHELTHGTIFLPGGADFNESLASFVGRQGALEFMRRRFGTESEEYARAVKAVAEEERRDARARELYRKLDDLYRSETSFEKKLELRDRVAGRRVNNAEILMQRRYGRYDEFREVFDAAGGEWPRFFTEVRARYASASR